MKNIIILFFILSLLLIAKGSEEDVNESVINEEESLDNNNEEESLDNNNEEESLDNNNEEESPDNNNEERNTEVDDGSKDDENIEFAVDNDDINMKQRSARQKLLEHLIKAKNILKEGLAKLFESTVEHAKKFHRYTDKAVKNIYYDIKVSREIDEDINKLINDACNLYKCEYIGLKKRYIFNTRGNDSTNNEGAVNKSSEITNSTSHLHNPEKCIYNELENYVYKMLKAKFSYMYTKRNSSDDSSKIKKAEAKFRVIANEIYYNVAQIINSIAV